MIDKKPHQPHELGALASRKVPLGGVKPSQFPCPFCGKTFQTRSEKERHKDTMHHEAKGHQ